MITAETTKLHWIRNEFNLPANLLQECSEAFVRKWDGKYICDNVHNGVFTDHNKKQWIVHWQSTPEVVKSAKQAALSFRVYKDVNYVIIKIWNTEMNDD